MRRATAVLGAALAAASLVTGCSSSGEKRTPSSSRVALPTVAKPAFSDAQLWDRSLCSKLDPAKVAKAAGTGMKVLKPVAAPVRKDVYSRIGAPTFDYCRVALRTGDGPLDVNYGVSATTWSAADWRAYVAAAQKGGQQGREYFGGHVERVGDHDALVERGPNSRGVMLVGDRLVAVEGTKIAMAESEQLVATLRLVLPLANELNPRPATIADPACAVAGAPAKAALGATAAVQRASREGSDLHCGWATHDAFVRVSAGPDAKAVQTVRGRTRVWSNAHAVQGVGVAAMYVEPSEFSTPNLQVATEESSLILSGQGTKVSKATLAAVAKPLIPYY